MAKGLKGVRTELDRDTVSASAVVDAPAEEVFDFLRRPANHRAISGDGSVSRPAGGDEVLGPGSTFGMNMRVGVPYRMYSQVVEFEADRLLAWAHLGGHRWRWVIEPIDDETCRVTETFDLSTSRFPPGLRALGFPKRHLTNVERSVANVVEHFASR